MPEKDKEKKVVEEKEAEEITFKCKFCGELKPLSEMTDIARLFPRVLVCRSCEKKMR